MTEQTRDSLHAEPDAKQIAALADLLYRHVSTLMQDECQPVAEQMYRAGARVYPADVVAVADWSYIRRVCACGADFLNGQCLGCGSH